MGDVIQKLSKDGINTVSIGDNEGIPMKCGDIECIFEIILYKYQGSEQPNEYRPRLFPPKQPNTSMAGSVALIVPSHILSDIQRNEFQRFLCGEGAIKLYAKSFTNPLEFELPKGRVPSSNCKHSPLSKTHV